MADTSTPTPDLAELLFCSDLLLPPKTHLWSWALTGTLRAQISATGRRAMLYGLPDTVAWTMGMPNDPARHTPADLATWWARYPHLRPAGFRIGPDGEPTPLGADAPLPSEVLADPRLAAVRAWLTPAPLPTTAPVEAPVAEAGPAPVAPVAAIPTDTPAAEAPMPVAAAEPVADPVAAPVAAPVAEAEPAVEDPEADWDAMTVTDLLSDALGLVGQWPVPAAVAVLPLAGDLTVRSTDQGTEVWAAPGARYAVVIGAAPVLGASPADVAVLDGPAPEPAPPTPPAAPIVPTEAPLPAPTLWAVGSDGTATCVGEGWDAVTRDPGAWATAERTPLVPLHPTATWADLLEVQALVDRAAALPAAVPARALATWTGPWPAAIRGQHQTVYVPWPTDVPRPDPLEVQLSADIAPATPAVAIHLADATRPGRLYLPVGCVVRDHSTPDVVGWAVLDPGGVLRPSRDGPPVTLTPLTVVPVLDRLARARPAPASAPVSSAPVSSASAASAPAASAPVAPDAVLPSAPVTPEFAVVDRAAADRVAAATAQATERATEQATARATGTSSEEPALEHALEHAADQAMGPDGGWDQMPGDDWGPPMEDQGWGPPGDDEHGYGIARPRDDEEEAEDEPVLAGGTNPDGSAATGSAGRATTYKTPWTSTISCTTWMQRSPSGELWASELLLTIATPDEIARAGCWVAIGLLRQGLTLSATDKHRFQDALTQIFRARVDQVRCFTVEGRTYFAWDRGTHVRLIGPRGQIVQTPKVQQVVAASYGRPVDACFPGAPVAAMSRANDRAAARPRRASAPPMDDAPPPFEGPDGDGGSHGRGAKKFSRSPRGGPRSGGRKRG